MTDLEQNWEPVRFNDDGELEGGLFCAYCGEINEPGAESCTSCGKYIADQGPDLKARLSRIRRYASTVHQDIADRPSADLIGSDPARRKGFFGSRAESYSSRSKYIADQGPDLDARLRRIRRYASSVHQDTGEKPPTDLISSDQARLGVAGSIGWLFLLCLFGPGRLEDPSPPRGKATKRKQHYRESVEAMPAPDPAFWREPVRLAVGFCVGFCLGLLIVFLLSH